MATYFQKDRPMTVKTPLGDDVLLLMGLSGQEAISQLFGFQLELLAENKSDIAFDKLLGQPITVTMELPEDKKRYFSGICSRLSECDRDTNFTVYRMEIVPKFWLLTRVFRSRIFQHITVPDILKKVLDGIEVDFGIQGTFKPRDYCVQYRETDFNFASRLMEEEGIYYFFKHAKDGHRMVVSNTAQSHQDLANYPNLTIEEVGGGKTDEDLIHSWEKTQELRSGKILLWDHCFELPHKHLEADKSILESVTVGTVTHKLKVGGNDTLEYFEYPGEYAQRFDGVNRSGGDQAGDLQEIFNDNKRTVALRMQQEELNSLIVSASCHCRDLTPGYKFTLKGHFNADGKYLITAVQHSATLGGYRSDLDEFEYHNTFQCIPVGLSFLPNRMTPKPLIHGTQTAVVVGPSGEEIFTDKYGRVKVQFHWDRDGKYDTDSSCWVRVASTWAGRNWGAIHIPRIGHEVVLAFQEGDPDQPLIVGSVYNADMMPPYKLPDEKTKSAIKSDTTVGHGGFNEIRLEDKKGSEQIFINGQKDLHIRAKNDRREEIGNDRELTVVRDNIRWVKRDQHLQIDRDLVEKMTRDHFLTVDGKRAMKIKGSNSMEVTGDVIEEFKSNHVEKVTATLHLKAADIKLEASSKIELVAGGSSVILAPAGVYIKGSMVYINSGSGPSVSPPSASLVSPTDPKQAQEPDSAEAGSGKVYQASSTAQQAKKAAEKAEEAGPTYKKEENKNKKSWIEIELLDDDGNPCPGEPYQIKLPDGSVDTGTLDEKGRAYVQCDPGTAEITFPGLDKDAWKPK
jgi:type VI secretion system secreted protein VgrG